MTRILLASIGLAVLQLGTPQPAGAADLGPRGESVRPVPASEAPSKGTLTRPAPRPDEVRSADATSFAPAASCGLGPEPSRGDGVSHDPAGSTPASAGHVLPLPRAPPA